MKPNLSIKSVIFQLDQNFGRLRRTTEQQLAGIDLTPGAASALKRFEELNLQVALVLADPLPPTALAVLQQFLPTVSAFILHERDWGKTFGVCAARIACEPGQTIFVSADRMVRGLAAQHGFQASPHPAIALMLARGSQPQFVHAEGQREQFERLTELVPYHAEFNGRGWRLLAVMSRHTLTAAGKRGMSVKPLPLDLALEDPLFVQLDGAGKQTEAALDKQKVLWRDAARALVALGPAQFNDALPLHGAHGHFQLLLPDPGLLRPATASANALRRARLALGRWPLDKIKVSRLPLELNIRDFVLTLCPVTAATFQADVDRYSGVAALDSSGPIVSRHSRHADNARVVQALLKDLNEIGYCAYTHDFTYAGMTLQNVIADLPGTGYFRLNPHLLERVREIFLKHPLPDPPEPWSKPLSRLIGSAWLKAQTLAEPPPLERRRRLEALFEFRPWFPWWLKRCPLPGLGAELVIAGCHLDSTAARTAGYNPVTDPAPGRDDNASGIAATLALARYLWNWRGRLPHTVRFCFFNAEEQGLIGSQAYAAMLKAAGAPIRAVVCADMIGYNSDAQRIFEIHAGATDPAVRDLSVPLAHTIAAWANCLGALETAQIYQGTSSTGGPDRTLYDGAIGRSDHGAFQQQGYPAVVVSEDFFMNLVTEPGADPNPNYHKEDDTVIDSAYAADITCALAFAVKELAGG